MADDKAPPLMFSGNAADMLKQYGKAVPEQQPMSSLEDAQAAKALMDGKEAHHHDGHACTEDHSSAHDHSECNGDHGHSEHGHKEHDHAVCNGDHGHEAHGHEEHGHKEHGHKESVHGHESHDHHDHSKCDGDHAH